MWSVGDNWMCCCSVSSSRCKRGCRQWSVVLSWVLCTAAALFPFLSDKQNKGGQGCKRNTAERWYRLLMFCSIDSSLVRWFLVQWQKLKLRLWCNHSLLCLPSIYHICIIMFHTLCIWEGNTIDWNAFLNRLTHILFFSYVSKGPWIPSVLFSCCSLSFSLANVSQRQYMQTWWNPAVEYYSITNSQIPSSIIYLSYHSIGSLDCGKTLQCRRTLLCLLHCSGTPCRLHCLAPNDVSSKWAKHRWWAWLNFC